MTRLVAMADTHLQHRRSKIRVPDGDILVHAGDALNAGETLAEVREFVFWFNQFPHRHKIYVAGNHDWAFDPGWNNTPVRLAAHQLLRDAGIIYLQDSEITVEGIRFYGSPWQPEFCNWAFNLPRDGFELKYRWDAIPDALDVLITHCPPQGILDQAFDGRHGCKLLRERIQEVPPKIHIFGHLHVGYGQQQVGSTLFVNAAVCNMDYDPINPPHILEI